VSSASLPYGRQSIDDDDVAAVVEVLRSDWLTTGPAVPAFEQALARTTGAKEAVAVSNGTAALHAAMHVLDVGPGDEVITPTLTFAASANCAVYQGARPVFADVDPATLLLDPASVARLLTPRTKAVVAVDYAGQPCDYEALRRVLAGRDVALVADAAHALGASDRGVPAGRLADVSTFSFHPVKHITTAEGGALVTDDPERARRARVFRNHGITTDHRQRERAGTWTYDMVTLGYNYRLSDLQCALGRSQLSKLPGWLARRRALARLYDERLREVPGVRPLVTRAGVEHAYHLYVVRLDDPTARDAVMTALRARGIGVNLHYRPVHLHPYYRERFATHEGQCPVAEDAWTRLISLPMFPGLMDDDVVRVVDSLRAALGAGAPG
jgi:perosamine synthetase